MACSVSKMGFINFSWCNFGASANALGSTPRETEHSIRKEYTDLSRSFREGLSPVGEVELADLLADRTRYITQTSKSSLRSDHDDA